MCVLELLIMFTYSKDLVNSCITRKHSLWMYHLYTDSVSNQLPLALLKHSDFDANGTNSPQCDICLWMKSTSLTYMAHCQYKDDLSVYTAFHYKDKIVLRPYYFQNGYHFTGKTASLYWDRSQIVTDLQHTSKQEKLFQWKSVRLSLIS